MNHFQLNIIYLHKIDKAKTYKFGKRIIMNFVAVGFVDNKIKRNNN